MISRYALFEIENLSDTFSLPDGVPRGTKRNYNISPTRSAPVVVSREGLRVMERKKWGFIPKNAADTRSVFRYKTYAIRSEVVFSKPTWDKAVRHERCLVPMNGFYEWHVRDGKKEAYFVSVVGRSLFSVAGMYSTWIDADGREHGTFSVLTIDSHSSSLHTKIARPIILDTETEEIWLDTTVSDMGTLYAAMKTYTDDILTITRVGDTVNSVKANSPELIQPITTI